MDWCLYDNGLRQEISALGAQNIQARTSESELFNQIISQKKFRYKTGKLNITIAFCIFELI